MNAVSTPAVSSATPNVEHESPGHKLAASKSLVVLITGASTGIGRATALALSRAGHRVYAGVRRNEDADELTRVGPTTLHPVFLEVTDSQSLARVAGELAQREGLLDVLINNAGVAFVSPLEIVDLEAARRLIGVNLFGPLLCIQAFLPLIRQARGRIVNVGSAGGRVAMPFLGMYDASKFALEALTNSLRLELAPWKIRVSLIEAGTVQTAIVERSRHASEKLLQAMPERGQKLYGGVLREMLDHIGDEISRAPTAEQAARVVCRAATEPRPRYRYHTDRTTAVLMTVAKLSSDRVRDWLLVHIMRLPKNKAGVAT